MADYKYGVSKKIKGVARTLTGAVKKEKENPMEEKAPEQEPVEEVQEETPEATEEETKEPEGEPEAPAEEPAAEEPAPEEKPPSRRESLRIQQLISKFQQQPEATKPDVLNYGEALETDPETVKTLEADREAYGQTREAEAYKKASEAVLFKTRLEIDAPKVEGKYKFLDKSDTENFNPAAADAINSWYLQMVGYDPKTDTVQNPGIRYSDFVEATMELADNIAGNKVAESTKNITQQAATTGLRPDGSQTKKLDLNKDPGQMSDEELEAVIGQAIPKK